MSTNTLLKLAALLVLAAAMALVGCEGDEGPAGPAGPEGPAGPPGDDASTSEFTFVGENGQACIHCHANTVEEMLLTAHTDAYVNMDAEDQESPYCLQCHTVGWDRPVAFPGDDSWMTAENPDTMGYDDYFGVETEEAEERRMALAGVQCENCHGAMGPDFNDHQPAIAFADIGTHDPESIQADDITSLCYPCHSTQFEGPEGDFTGGYATSGHASVAGGDLDAFNDEHYAHIGSCAACHTAEGFIAANDPALANYEFGHDVNFIGCVTCHDPHAGAEGSGNSSQLRNVGDSILSYTFPYEPDDPEAPTMSGYGNGQLCAQCHKGRRDNDNVAGQIANGYAYFGPHHSAQADMFIGHGSYEIAGDTYDRTHIHQSAEQGCVSCHMVRETVLHGDTQEFAFHNFRPDVGTNCSGCHGDAFGENDITTFQDTIVALMDDLATRFGYADYHDMEENWDSTADGVESWEREAAYAMYFVIGDGSLGVHNPDYTIDLLNNAIAYHDANAPGM